MPAIAACSRRSPYRLSRRHFRFCQTASSARPTWRRRSLAAPPRRPYGPPLYRYRYFGSSSRVAATSAWLAWLVYREVATVATFGCQDHAAGPGQIGPGKNATEAARATPRDGSGNHQRLLCGESSGRDAAQRLLTPPRPGAIVVDREGHGNCWEPLLGEVIWKRRYSLHCKPSWEP